MASKRPIPEHDSPPKDKSSRRNKKHKRNQQSANAVDCCHVCNEMIIEGDHNKGEPEDDAMYCEGKCDTWIHRKCAGLSKQQYEALTEEDAPYISPHCMLGNQALVIKELKDLVNTLSADILSLKNQVADLKTNQAQPSMLQNDIADQQSNNELDTGDTPRPPPLPTSADKHIKTMFNDYINEEKEKAKRRLNIIIHSIPESASEDGNARKKHDTDFVANMFQQHLDTKVSITKCFRIGKKDAKPRLLKMSLGTEVEKAKILRNCTKLHDLKLSPDLHKVFITPDLITKEREANKNLRAQLKEMNKGG